MFILIGKIFYLLIWLFLLLNIVYPYPQPANIIAYIALISLFLMHGLQACFLHSSLTTQEKQQDRFRTLRMFLFGTFEVLSWKKRRIDKK